MPPFGIVEGESGGMPASYRPRRSPIDDFIARLGRLGGPFAIPDMTRTLPTPVATPAASMNPNPETVAEIPQPSFAERYKTAEAALPPLNLPPWRADELQRQYEQTYVHPPKPTFGQTLGEAVRQLAPVGLGALFGGQAGAAGAAGGVEQYNLQQQALKEQRRKEFQQGIEAQRGREERLAERELTQRGADIRAIMQEQTVADKEAALARRQAPTTRVLGDRTQQWNADKRVWEDIGPAPTKADTSTSEFEYFIKTHPGADIEDWLKIKQQFEKPTEMPHNTVTTDEGVFQYNPTTQRYDIKVGPRPRTEQAEPGSYLPYTDARGVVQYWVNPKTKQVVKPESLGLGQEDLYKGPLAVERQKIETAATSGLKAIAKLREELKKPGTLAALAVPGSPGARTAMAARNEMVDVLTRIRTGAALNADEQAFYNRQAPGLIDSLFNDPDTIAYKLSIFEDNFKGLAPPEKKTPSGGGAVQDWIRDPVTKKLRPKQPGEK